MYAEKWSYTKICMNAYQIVSESLEPQITLQPFDDKSYYELVTKTDQNLSHIDLRSTKNSMFHTIKYEDEICGFIGGNRLSNDKTISFINIVILKQFRGKGILKEVYKLFVRQYSLKELWATIRKSNERSISAHLKIGFKYFPQDRLDEWYENKRMDKSMTRMYKKY